MCPAGNLILDLESRKAGAGHPLPAFRIRTPPAAVVAIDRAIHGFTPNQPAANDDGGMTSESTDLDRGGDCWGIDSDLFSDSTARHDVLAALSYMSDEQQNLFDLLATHQDLPTAARDSGMSSATFYRRVADLQMHLRMFGIRPTN